MGSFFQKLGTVVVNSVIKQVPNLVVGIFKAIMKKKTDPTQPTVVDKQKPK